MCWQRWRWMRKSGTLWPGGRGRERWTNTQGPNARSSSSGRVRMRRARRWRRWQRLPKEDAMIGIIPAAGAGQRIQPLGFPKELLPVGSRVLDGVERPKAVSEYLVERMIAAGADQICFI